MRYSGQIAPFIPSTAPLELRLPQAIYDESSPMGPTSTGPGLSMPLGDIDDGWGAVNSTGSLMPGRPLRAARGPVARVAPPPSTPSWVRTDRMLALQGCGCGPSAMGDINLAGTAFSAALAGGLFAVVATLIGADAKKGVMIGAGVGAALSLYSDLKK